MSRRGAKAIPPAIFRPWHGRPARVAARVAVPTLPSRTTLAAGFFYLLSAPSRKPASTGRLAPFRWHALARKRVLTPFSQPKAITVQSRAGRPCHFVPRQSSCQLLLSEVSKASGIREPSSQPHGSANAHQCGADNGNRLAGEIAAALATRKLPHRR